MNNSAQAWYNRRPVFREEKKGPGRGWWGPPKGTHGTGKGGFGDPKAVVSDSEPMSSSAKPTIVEFSDGSRGIHKYNKNVAYGNPVGEVMTYEISEALGWGVVPETINWEREGESGTLQEFVPDSRTWAGVLKAGTEGEEDRILLAESPEITLLDAMLKRYHGDYLWAAVED